MKIRLSEEQNALLVKCYINEAMSEGFSFETLQELPTFNARLKYCKQMLGFPIGNGSSRIVFQLDDKKVLKLAKNQKGIAQNEAECDWYVQNNHSDVVPLVFENESDTDDFTFLVSEYVLPCKNQDFKQVFGFDFETFRKLMVTIVSCYNPRVVIFGKLTDEEYQNLWSQNEELIQSWYDYLTNCQPPLGDLRRIVNYGMVKRYNDVYIVLLDSGLTDEIYKEYYARR